MTKKIEKTAENYQAIKRQIKDLEAKAAPLKKEIIDYAKEHDGDFDDSFQLKFGCGVFVGKKIKQVLTGKSKDKEALLDKREEYAKIVLDDKHVVEDAVGDARLRKTLDQLNLKVEDKITLAVYSN